jgi:SAM-dependent methyltransferase
MDWKHGYYADSGYTYGYYAETSPLRLAWASLLQGHHSPTQQFRYLDAGCGQGLNLILIAAAHPESEFVGIDFLPEHVAHARALARECNLDNVQFIEGDFLELASNYKDLGTFDYAVCHGITTWIAPEVRASLFDLIGKTLNPGGVFYNSYNTFPGWLSTTPFQHLVLLEQRSKSGNLALSAAKEHMDLLSGAAPQMFKSLPNLVDRLKRLKDSDPAYLVQEYNNNFWQPVFVSKMIDEMAKVKLNYLGTATLPEAFDLVLDSTVRSLLEKQQVLSVREQLRDYAINQSFRRDLYVKGFRKPWSVDQSERVRSTKFVRCPSVVLPEPGKPFPIRSGSLELNGEPVFYNSLLTMFSEREEGVTVDHLLSSTDEDKKQGVVAAVSMLLHGGWIMPIVSASPDTASTHTNSALGRSISAGAPYRYISVPRCGGAIPLSDAEWFVVDAYIRGIPENEWVAHVDKTLAKLGRGMTKEGQLVTDREEKLKMIDKVISDLKTQKFKYLKLAGALS